MNPDKILRGKRILVVDDEKDILDFLVEHLEMCKIDTALSYEEAKKLLESNAYSAAVLDIMGVRGYELLELANKKGVPALMLTAHALSQENLKKSFEGGASYYVPKDEMSNIDIYLADVFEAIDKKRNIWSKWYERLSGFCDRRFGPNWKDEDPEFWDNLLKY